MQKVQHRPLFSSCDVVGESFDDPKAHQGSEGYKTGGRMAQNDLQSRISFAQANLPYNHFNSSSASPPLDEQKMF